MSNQLPSYEEAISGLKTPNPSTLPPVQPAAPQPGWHISPPPDDVSSFLFLSLKNANQKFNFQPVISMSTSSSAASTNFNNTQYQYYTPQLQPNVAVVSSSNNNILRRSTPARTCFVLVAFAVVAFVIFAIFYFRIDD